MFILTVGDYFNCDPYINLCFVYKSKFNHIRCPLICPACAGNRSPELERTEKDAAQPIPVETLRHANNANPNTAP